MEKRYVDVYSFFLYVFFLLTFGNDPIYTDVQCHESIQFRLDLIWSKCHKSKLF